MELNDKVLFQHVLAWLSPALGKKVYVKTYII